QLPRRAPFVHVSAVLPTAGGTQALGRKRLDQPNGSSARLSRGNAACHLTDSMIRKPVLRKISRAHWPDRWRFQSCQAGLRITRSREEFPTATKARLASSKGCIVAELIGNGFRCPSAKPGSSSRSNSPVATDDRANVSIPT